MDFSNPNTAGAVGAIFMLFVAGAALYTSARAAVGATGGGQDNPTRTAIGHWLPVAVVAIVATLLDRSDVAVGVIFSVSVACLSIVPGLGLLVGRLDKPEWPDDEPVAARPTGGLLAVGLMLLLIGFAGRFTLIHGLILAFQGVAVLLLRKPDRVTPQTLSGPMRLALFVLVLVVSTLGAYVATRGMAVIVRRSPFFSFATLSTVALGPLLSLPMIGAATEQSRFGRSDAVLRGGITVTLLNFCLLLPLVIGLFHLLPQKITLPLSLDPTVGFPTTVPTTGPSTLATTGPTTAAAPDPINDDSFGGRSLSYPLAVWRIDTVLLVALGFLLLPVGQGRWKLGAIEGVVLIVVYTAYVMAVARFGLKWG